MPVSISLLHAIFLSFTAHMAPQVDALGALDLMYIVSSWDQSLGSNAWSTPWRFSEQMALAGWLMFISWG